MSNKLEAEEKQEEIQKDLLAKMDIKKFTTHKQSIEEVLKAQKTDLKKGLTSADAKARLEKHGPNELTAEPEKSLWESIAEQFEDILVRILLASATISFIIAITGKSYEYHTGENGLDFVVKKSFGINLTSEN